MIETQLSHFPARFHSAAIPSSVWVEAKKRVLDSFACYFGAFQAKPNQVLRKTFLLSETNNGLAIWGTTQKTTADLAAWINGTGVRMLDYNDTYLSKEPCHPSDLLSSLWAACRLSGSSDQGKRLLEALVLGYETVCRLCDAHSLRAKGWDHVNYIGIASAVACSYIFNSSSEKTRHAVALTVVANNALRQTRLGTISDWKASCAAYAARAGLNAARLAAHGFTGPDHVFSGKFGFQSLVSGSFDLPKRPWGRSWKIMQTHTKFFPAEHHAQSAIEAAIELSPLVKGKAVKSIRVDSFDASVDIIGSEREKWNPITRETADHSLPYLVCAALREGTVNLRQYERALFRRPDIRELMRKTTIHRHAPFNKIYPAALPARVSVRLQGGEIATKAILRPKGYAGRPMTWDEVEQKFHRLSSSVLSAMQRRQLLREFSRLERLPSLVRLETLLASRGPQKKRKK